jgi:CBS domain-containing protein
MRARDVMTRAVATTTPEATVETVARLLINLRISGSLSVWEESKHGWVAFTHDLPHLPQGRPT